MKRNISIKLGSVALLIALLFSVICLSKNEEQKRWELLKQNSWLHIDQDIIIGGERMYITYGVQKFKSRFVFLNRIEEFVYVKAQNKGYLVSGRGNRIKAVLLDQNHSLRRVIIWVSTMEASPFLPRKVIEKIVEDGTTYYFLVREHFKVDTYEGLKKVIEIEKPKRDDRLNRLLNKNFK